MALFDTFKTPDQILAERNAAGAEAIRAAQAKGQSGFLTGLGQGLGNFGTAFLREGGFNIDPEITAAQEQQEIVQGISDLSDPEQVLEAARKFRAIGNLEQSTRLVDRALALQSAPAKAEKAQLEVDIKKEDLAKKQAENQFAKITKNARLKKVLAEAGISEEDLARLTLQNARRSQGLSPDAPASAAKPEKPAKVEKDLDVSVDAAMGELLAEIDEDLAGEPKFAEARDRIRERTRDILNSVEGQGMSPSEAARLAVSDVAKVDKGFIFDDIEVLKKTKARDLTPRQAGASAPAKRIQLTLPTQ